MFCEDHSRPVPIRETDGKAGGTIILARLSEKDWNIDRAADLVGELSREVQTRWRRSVNLMQKQYPSSSQLARISRRPVNPHFPGPSNLMDVGLSIQHLIGLGAACGVVARLTR